MTRQLTGPRPDAVFSQAVRVGDVICVSGQVAINQDREIVGIGDSEAQARQCFANLARILDEAGASMQDLTRVNAYLTDTAHYSGYAAAKNDYLKDILPAGTVVIVAGLMDPRFLMEIDAIAVVADE